MISGGVGIARRDDVVGILVLALQLRGARSIVILGRLGLGLVVLIGVLVEGGLVVARGRGWRLEGFERQTRRSDALTEARDRRHHRRSPTF